MHLLIQDFFILCFFKSFPQSYWIFETWCNSKILNWFRKIGQVFIHCALIGPCAFIWNTMVPFYSPLTLFCTQIWQYGVIQHITAKVIYFKNYKNSNESCTFVVCDLARTYLQLPLRQWGAGNVYLLVLFSWKVNIAENPIAVMGL